MPELPKISILLLTYRRTEMAIQTVESTCKNLGYPRELLSFYVADDGSPREHFDSVMNSIKHSGVQIIGYHSKRMRHPGQEDTYNAGLGWNKGLGVCHQNTDFVIVEEDDWVLRNPFDIRPYVKLLSEVEQVGIVTFRTLSVGADLHSVGYDGIHYLKYLKSTQYAYSGNPYLRHARFTRHFGWFAEDRSPGNIELDMDSRFRIDPTGPQIWRPAGIDPWGVFAHVGTDKTWE